MTAAQNETMEKLEVNALKSTAGSISEYVWYAIGAEILGFVLSYLGNNEIVGEGFGKYGSAICFLVCVFFWVLFLYYFAVGCKQLPNKEYKNFTSMMWCYAAGGVCFILEHCFELPIFIIIGLVPNIFALILWYKIGKSFSSNYRGLLSEIGKGMLNILWKILILLGISILYVILVILTRASETIAIVGALIILAYMLWLIYLMFKVVCNPMNEIIERGYFEP